VYNGDEPLDRLFIHPEQYENVYSLLNFLHLTPDNANLIRLKLKNMNFKEICLRFNIGELTMEDIIANLESLIWILEKRWSLLFLKKEF